MEGRERPVLYYKTVAGISPFRESRNRIGDDDDARAAVDARIARLRGGNFGDCKPIGEGAAESRIHVGAGYRIYYGIDGEAVVLLCAGDKSTQDRDIAIARKYWKDYKKRERERKGAEREKEVLKNVRLQKGSSKRFEK
jgi:putative addiction module killer protein